LKGEKKFDSVNGGGNWIFRAKKDGRAGFGPAKGILEPTFDVTQFSKAQKDFWKG